MKAPPGPSMRIRISPKAKRKNLPAAGSFFLAELERFELSRSF
jgi:hypothetical protein